MRIVKDYKSFSQYKEEIDKIAIPYFKDIVEKAFSSSDFKKVKLYRALGWSAVASSILFVVLMIVLFMAQVEKGGAYLALLIFLVISIIVGIVFFVLLSKIKSDIFSVVNSSVDEEQFYKKAFNVLDPNFNYLGFNHETKNSHLGINKKELSVYRTSMPAEAFLIDVSKETEWFIDNKYPTFLVNSLWKHVKVDRKGDTHETFYNSSLLKINTHALGDKGFAFTLFNGTFDNWFSSLKKIQFENKEFNKIFKMHSDNEIKSRMMYTPLSMELSLKRLRDNINSKVKNFKVYSTGEEIYFSFSTDMGFMFMDIPRSLNKEKVIRKMYNDFMLDTYTLYYLLSIIYTPLYLD
ncbi:DUF3137 domain-containing protein [Mycoplasmopsis canis]|uniref:DUF3137 domain-containing protein n=1 Tax=Mycoplasmopsis canis TaxID=29555 RepID=UPI00025B035D|nr:DUF3137 domain-containing protein [Mycoplasmopsis canis]EIE39348.1 hypothetical protein MCANUF33_03065 [Mycoplasmopsis canis UF33]